MCVSSLSVCLQTRQQDLSQQQSQASRLDQLELQLQSLAAKTEVQQHFIFIIIIIISFSDSQKLQSLLTSGPFGSLFCRRFSGDKKLQSHLHQHFLLLSGDLPPLPPLHFTLRAAVWLLFCSVCPLNKQQV